MGKRKITCNNSSCKHHTNGGCDTCITLDGSGKCKSFEKGFAYYFHIVWDALDNKNFTELTCKSKYQIIGILLRNGEKVPKSIENQLYKRLDALDAQIF